MKRLVWIIGRGGLLGSALARSVAKRNDFDEFKAPHFHWQDSALNQELSTAVDTFAKQSEGKSWTIYYAAGLGIMSSTEQELAKETATLQSFLDLLEKSALNKSNGTLMLASSAGAIYAGSQDETITESSVPAPLSAYAREKLRQEEIVKGWATRVGAAALIARLSTLYGCGQSGSKKQGLLTHIARSILTKKPIHIFVPFDTIRDYLHVDDAAAMILEATRVENPLPNSKGAGFLPAGRIITKIFASEEPATIAEIIGTFKKIARTAPLVITSPTKEKTNYPHRMVFHSTVKPTVGARQTTLLIGAADLLAHERLTLAKGGK